MAYGALPDTVPTERARTGAVLREWGLVPGDVLTVVSELVSNGVRASGLLPQPRPVRVWVCSDGARVLVQVGDENPAQPVRVTPDLKAEHGRGLLVVEALSTGWGWFPATSHGLAKLVWADVLVPQPPACSPNEGGRWR